MDTNRIKNFSQPTESQKISHLSFADDVLIFCNGSKKTLTRLRNFLDYYQNISGQLLNVNKCTFTVARDVHIRRIRIIEHTTGFKKHDIPFKYLGCPIFNGRVKAWYFNDLIDSIRNRVEGWKTNLLNQAGRLVLLNHVLMSIPVHIFAALSPPISVLKEIDKITSKCFWRNSDNEKGHHWIAWNDCCQTKADGGIGLRKFKDIIHVQSLNLCWKLLSQENLWCSFMKGKYHKDFTDLSYRSSKTSPTWKRVRGVLEEALAYTSCSDTGLRWNLSSNGKFSFKHTWVFIRKVGNPSNRPFEFIWCKPIPKKVSICLWKILHNKLPLDHNIQKIGIQMVSRCSCCKNHKSENQTHLFLRSDIACKVWDYFSNKIGITNIRSSLSTYLKNWWLRAPIEHSSSIIFHCLPALVCWEIWKSRNRAIFDDIPMKAESIIFNIKQNFADLANLNSKKIFNSEIDACIREILSS